MKILNPTYIPALLVPCLLGLTHPASADTVAAKCPDLQKCAFAVAELTGQNYVFPASEGRGGPILSSANYELTTENAEEILTRMLDQNEYTRVPLSKAGSFTILRHRDARDSVLPILHADARTLPTFPKVWDLASLRYRLDYPLRTESICRTLRSFMPPASRVIPDEISGQIFLTASYPILENLVGLIRSLDVKLSPAQVKKLEAQARGAKAAERRAAVLPPPAPQH